VRKKQCFLAILTLLAGPVAALAQTATTTKAKYDTWWLPDRASSVADTIDGLFYLILWITSAVFVLVFVLMIYFIIKYRAREGRKAIYSHGNNKLEIAWTVIPALILVFLGIISQTVWSDIKIDAPDEKTSLVIEVRPRQFQWDVRYSGADGVFGKTYDSLVSGSNAFGIDPADPAGKDDITRTNEIHVPIGKDVLIHLRAMDVIHSFFVPEFLMKQDAVPGMLTSYWFKATKVGGYEIACAELCGLGHYRMRGFLTVHDQAGYDAWYSEQNAAKAKENAPPPVATEAPATTTDTAAAASAAPGTDSAAASGTDTIAGGADTAAGK
jgi:cytochrome c oxidase subunit II